MAFTSFLALLKKKTHNDFLKVLLPIFYPQRFLPECIKWYSGIISMLAIFKRPINSFHIFPPYEHSFHVSQVHGEFRLLKAHLSFYSAKFSVRPSFSLPVSTWVGSDFGWMSADMDTTGVVVPFCFPSTHVFRIYLSFLRSAFGSRQYFNDHDRAQVNVFFYFSISSKDGTIHCHCLFRFPCQQPWIWTVWQLCTSYQMG